MVTSHFFVFFENLGRRFSKMDIFKMSKNDLLIFKNRNFPSFFLPFLFHTALARLVTIDDASLIELLVFLLLDHRMFALLGFFQASG